MYSTFSERLKELRMERGLSTTQLGKHIDMCNSIISLWENEKRDPTLKSLLALTKYFEVTMDFLVGLTEY